MDAVEQWLSRLAARLAGALGEPELLAATAPPEGLGIERRLDPAELSVGGRSLLHPLPGVVLEITAGVDAARLCEAWHVERPVAVSGDVGQARWNVVAAGNELADPNGRRIETSPLRAGSWQLRPRLAARPGGPLPEVVAGASPAYDVRERGGRVERIEVTPVCRPSAIVGADHEHAQLLWAPMRRTYPSWHGGWGAGADADVVVVYERDLPVAGAAIRDGDGLLDASCLCVVGDQEDGTLGSALLDVLEAVALARGCGRLRVDSSAFLQSSRIPHGRRGYVVGPPYDGDADVEVWAERDLAVAVARRP